ncbi:hypothetical protein CXB51_024514 [Gossypium anomalum]|uniref:Nucleoside phosphorylase domain-containing protein n=1 Tax=Gossypium anomalum TaxID=47600 RepID=A0A8J5YJ42_9ROSI|nr:hypothetical protein CXB51_024514 [Gossypium anomalum]
MAATQLKPCLVLLLTFSLLAFASAISRNRIKSLNQIKEVNRKGPYIGLITVIATEEDAFFASVAATQQMVDLFDIKGIIHFGIAGNTNNSMSIGDVTIPNQIAHTGLWEWLNTKGTLDFADVSQLEIGDYNVPKGNGTNLLGHIGYMEEEYYSVAGEPNVAESLLWANISLQWLQLASNLEGMKLEQCVNSSLCLTEKPKLVVGLRASTSNIFLDNAAYRDFLFQKFGTSLSNGYPVIVIRGLSDLAGNQEGDNVVGKFGGLAAVNSVKAVLGFIRNLPPITR